MKQLYIREINKKEIQEIYKGIKSSSAFTHRRCQILLSSAEGKNTTEISLILYCSDQCVRDAINQFNKKGVKSLEEKSHARNSDQKVFKPDGIKKLKEIINNHPSDFGIKNKFWTLNILAKLCYKKKIIKKPVSSRTIGLTLKRIGVNWIEVRKISSNQAK